MIDSRFLSLTVLVGAVLLVGSLERAQAKLEVGEKPRFSVKTMSGRQITHRKLQGRIIIMEFWATWCGPCVEQIPHLRKLHKKYRSEGVALVSVSQDRSEQKAQRFAKEHGMTWPQVHDASHDRQLGDVWGVKGIPHAFIFSPNGKLLWRGHPANMEKHIQRALKKFGDQLKVNQPDEAKQSAKPGEKAQQTASAKAESPAGSNSAADQPAWRAAAERVGEAYRLLRAQPPKVKQALGALAKVDKTSLTHKNLRSIANRLASAASRVEKEHAAALKQARQDEPTGAKRLAALREAVANGAYRPVPAKQLRQAKLKRAERLQEAGRDLKAYEQYKWLAKRAANTPAGKKAAKQIKQYEADASFMNQRRQQKKRAKAKELLSLARNYENAGRSDLAEQKYQSLIEQYPGTDAAATAKQALKN